MISSTRCRRVGAFLGRGQYRSSRRTVGVAFDGRFLLWRELNPAPPGDPVTIFVAFMCAYTLNIAHGALPGPYRDEDTHTYARACLIPAELLERPGLDIARAATVLHQRAAGGPPSMHAGARPVPEAAPGANAR